jgi:hypothetical protein
VTAARRGGEQSHQLGVPQLGAGVIHPHLPHREAPGQSPVQNAERGLITPADRVNEPVNTAMSDLAAGEAAAHLHRHVRLAAADGTGLNSHGNS